ncbi:hypothetical protein FGO68_gene14573 [Halteria grandinella]|uniref:Uncharacterized protein n=1 Tax=Halteria grandinella TaxID=5974 RepID=A0A8J8N9W6_HALGN|nr:hypothetical protein FGO68_gene14573 [Halteria grandinella]
MPVPGTQQQNPFMPPTSQQEVSMYPPSFAHPDINGSIYSQQSSSLDVNTSQSPQVINPAAKPNSGQQAKEAPKYQYDYKAE